MTPVALIAAVAVTGALFFAVQGMMRALTRDRRTMAARLAAQQASGAGAAITFEYPVAEGLLRREGRLGERLGGVPLMATWRRDIQRAGLSWQARDYVGVIAVSAAMFGTLTLVVTGSPYLALAAMSLGALAPILFVKQRVAKRSSLLNSQVADMIDLLAASLRSGFGVLQSLELAAKEQPEPMAAELLRTIREMNLGVSADEALERLADRTGDEDIDLVVMAILIQRRVGGNLSEVLGNISQTIRDRVKVRGEIRTLTAQARMSSWIVGMLPVGLGVTLTMMRPEYMSVLWTDPAGRLLSILAVAMEIVGFYLVRRIAAIDY